MNYSVMIMLRLLVASNCATNRENVKQDLCLNLKREDQIFHYTRCKLLRRSVQ